MVNETILEIERQISLIEHCERPERKALALIVEVLKALDGQDSAAKAKDGE